MPLPRKGYLCFAEILFFSEFEMFFPKVKLPLGVAKAQNRGVKNLFFTLLCMLFTAFVNNRIE